MFTLTRRFRADMRRLYVYNFTSDDCAGRFDSGVVRRDGTARPAYDALKRQIQLQALNLQVSPFRCVGRFDGSMGPYRPGVAGRRGAGARSGGQRVGRAAVGHLGRRAHRRVPVVRRARARRRRRRERRAAVPGAVVRQLRARGADRRARPGDHAPRRPTRRRRYGPRPRARRDARRTTTAPASRRRPSSGSRTPRPARTASTSRRRRSTSRAYTATATSTAPAGAPEPRYPEYTYEKVRVPMRDGVVLSTEIWRPVVPKGTKVPVILHLTPYHALSPAHGADRLPLVDGVEQVRRGYAFVFADVRGTWASGGCWNYGGSKERQDGYDLVEWLGKQPWSNGRVAMMGVSYPGHDADGDGGRAPAAPRRDRPDLGHQPLVRLRLPAGRPRRRTPARTPTSTRRRTRRPTSWPSTAARRRPTRPR